MKKVKQPNDAQRLILEDFGKRARLEVVAAETARLGLQDRWRKLWAMYRNEPGASGVTVLAELPPEHIPLIQPAVRKIVDSVSSALFSVSPLVNALDCVSNNNAKVLAEQYDKFTVRSNLRRVYKQVIESAAITGVGINYLPFVAGSGFESYYIPSERFFIAPVERSAVENCLMCGHQDWITESQYMRGVEEGRYFDWGRLSIGSPDASQVTTTTAFNKSLSDVPSREYGTEQSPHLVEIRQVFWHGEFKELEDVYYALYPDQKPPQSEGDDGDSDGAKQWWRLTLDYKTGHVLNFEPYPYRPPYIVTRLHDEPPKFLPGGSVAYNMQPLQNKFSELWNVLLAGTWLSAFPIVWVKNGQLAEKLKQLRVGAVLEAEGPIEVGSIPTPFNVEPVLAAIAKIEELAETVSNVSAIGTNQGLPNDTTATQVAALQQQQQQSEAAYTTHAGYGLEETIAYMHEVCGMNAQAVVDAYGQKLSPGFIDALEETPVFECVGKVATKGAAAQLALLQSLWAMSADPSAMMNRGEIAKRIVQEMDIDQTDDLFITPDQLQQNAGIPQMPGNEMVPGVLGGEVAGNNPSPHLMPWGGLN